MPDPAVFVLFSLIYSSSWLQQIRITNPDTVTLVIDRVVDMVNMGVPRIKSSTFILHS